MHAPCLSLNFLSLGMMICRGGGANFGPRPRSHAHKLPQNVQLLGMKCALSAKCNEGRMVVVDSLSSVWGSAVRPKAMVPMITSLMQGAGSRPASSASAASSTAAVAAAVKTALLVDSGEFGLDGGRALRTAAAMIRGVEVMGLDDITVYHVLKYNVLIISKPALVLLSKQLANPPHRNRLPLKKAWWGRELKEFEKAAAELRGGSISAAHAPVRELKA